MPLRQDIERQYRLAFDLNKSIKRGDKAKAEALLAFGAPVDGSNLLEYRPLTFTAVCGGADLARLVIEKGSDLNAGVVQDIFNDFGRLSVKSGTTALTMAIRNCHVDVFEMLIEAGADLNATDSTGFTPLMSASMGVKEAEKGVVMARKLLRAGADPTRVNDEGYIALTYAAAEGSADVVDMLLAKAPKTVSHVTFAGSTNLYGAVCHGNEAAVVCLLAAGAVQPRLYRPSYCPLVHAVTGSNERLVRILLQREGAVGGDAAIQLAMQASVIARRARFVQILLLSEGEGRQERWANCTSSVGRILHMAASCGTLDTLSVLLSAGADETKLDCNGLTASEVVGASSSCDGHLVTKEEATAMPRMLLRGPAFRARSWAWRVGRTGTTALHGGCGGACRAGEGSGGDAGEAGTARHRAPLAVRIYRPENKTLFLRYLGR